MAVIFVARSKTLAEWGGEVGLGKNLYRIGVTEGSGREAVKALNDQGSGGVTDWTLVAEEAAPGVEEASAIERIAKKEKRLDPAYYPRIKGTPGIFKVKPENVENYLLVKQALANEKLRTAKLKPADFGVYLLHLALKQ
ncbi:MAG TPA: hypothetical protein VJN41_09005 [Alphaproteobacteria bacterium]|nr:hypothetical protein [Alphaproteobacteria bacterium]